MRLTTHRGKPEEVSATASNATRTKRQPASLPGTQAVGVNPANVGPTAAQHVASQLTQRRDAPLAVSHIEKDTVAAEPTTPVTSTAPSVDAAIREPESEPEAMTAAIREGARTPLEDLRTEFEGSGVANDATHVTAANEDSTYVAASDATEALNADEVVKDKKTY